MSQKHVIEYIKSVELITKNEISRSFLQWLMKRIKSYEFDSSNLTSGLLCNIREFQVKDCYNNAVKIALRHPDIEYVQGYYCWSDLGNMPFGHAWNYNKKTKEVIDVSSQLIMNACPDRTSQLSTLSGIIVPKTHLWTCFKQAVFTDEILFKYYQMRTEKKEAHNV